MEVCNWKYLNLPKIYSETLGKLMKSAGGDNRIDKIILFGSCATGNINKNSDLDICFLTKTDLDWHEQIEFMDHDPSCYPGCDLIILTPSMLAAGKEKKWGVAYWVIKEGIELIGD